MKLRDRECSSTETSKCFSVNERLRKHRYLPEVPEDDFGDMAIEQQDFQKTAEERVRNFLKEQLELKNGVDRIEHYVPND